MAALLTFQHDGWFLVSVFTPDGGQPFNHWDAASFTNHGRLSYS
jgi:hypothetical protein